MCEKGSAMLEVFEWGEEGIMLGGIFSEVFWVFDKCVIVEYGEWFL